MFPRALTGSDMTRYPLRRPLLGLALSATAAGCAPDGNELVYIPAPGYQQALVVRADVPESGAIRPGEPLLLHANRLQGPWRQLRRSEVPDSVECVRERAPMSPEIDIASKLQWNVEPSADLRFNLPGPPEFERTVQFPRPGEYRLWAVSDAPCGGTFSSDTIRVRVE